MNVRSARLFSLAAGRIGRSLPRPQTQHLRSAPWRRSLAVGAALLTLPVASLHAQEPPQPYPAYPPPQSYPQQNYPQQQPPYGTPYPQYPQQDQQEAPPPPDVQPEDQPPPPGYGQPAPSYGSPYGAPPESQPEFAPAPEQSQALSPDQLEQLVAPVALYPDALLAQVLAAATYPGQIADADRWRQSQMGAPPEQIAAEANAQPWDPSIKALTAFPQVLAELDQNLQWTTELGNAYYNQPQDVFAAVQDLRRRAQAAGTLQDTPQETVGYDQGYIQLAPSNPLVVYVPSYNPWSVYGSPIAPYPGFSLLDTLGSVIGPAIQYGMGMVMTAFTPMNWGWLGWGLSWISNLLTFHNQGYYSHSASLVDWGLPRGGPRAWHGGYGRYDVARNGEGYGSRSGAYGGRYGDDRGPDGHGWRSGGSRFDPQQRFGRQRYPDSYRRGSYGYGRAGEGTAGMPAFNARSPYAARVPYARPARYGSAWNAGARSNWNGESRPSGSWSRPQTAFRGYGWSQPQRSQSIQDRAWTQTPRSAFGDSRSSAFGRENFNTRSSGGFKPSRSGSFRGFGGGFRSSSFRSGEFNSRSFRGGGSHFKMPREHSHFGGGHFGGGHGGHHRR